MRGLMRAKRRKVDVSWCLKNRYNLSRWKREEWTPKFSEVKARN